MGGCSGDGCPCLRVLMALRLAFSAWPRTRCGHLLESRRRNCRRHHNYRSLSGSVAPCKSVLRLVPPTTSEIVDVIFRFGHELSSMPLEQHVLNMGAAWSKSASRSVGSCPN